MQDMADEERAHLSALADMQGVDPSQVVYVKAGPLNIDDDLMTRHWQKALADRARDDRLVFEMRLPHGQIRTPTRTVRAYTLAGEFIGEVEEPSPAQHIETVTGGTAYTALIPASSITGPHLELLP